MNNLKQIDHKTINNFSIDENNKLYWCEKPVLTSWKLSIGQKITAAIVLIFTVISAVGSAAQGWAAYNEWACKHRPSWVSVCDRPNYSIHNQKWYESATSRASRAAVF